MSNVRKTLSNEKIKELLAGGEADIEIELDEATPGFSFSKFYDENKQDIFGKFTFNNGITILKSRKQIFAACKNNQFVFCGKQIAQNSDTADEKTWTFKRTEAVLRVLMAKMVEECTTQKLQQDMYSKLMSLPMVIAYGLNVPPNFDSSATRLMLCVGGPLPLLSSLPAMAPIAFPLAYFQNVKKQNLGIKNFSTYEQLCKVARVCDAAQIEFTGDLKKLFESATAILKTSSPGTASSISLKKYSEQIAHLEKAFGSKPVIDDFGSNSVSTSKPARRGSTGL
ncbi:N [Tomato necrotic ringspot virus]|nr:nucleocapsid protein [Tomato necrotic ringspot virus]QQY96600.1 N [Tomato necrotic ringspot virus] [Tomato necrotic ringspot virus]CBO84775.1 nucleocapsid protein [Tomato necrotic ringspot virus]